MGSMIHTGDCIEVMRGMEADSVDAVVTDPPYGLEFMGKGWDRLGDVGTISHPGVTTSSGSRDRSYNAAFGRLGKVAHNGSANRKCRRCKRWAWDHEGRKCSCEVSDFPNVEGHQARLMQEWHFGWAVEALRVTKPGGYLLAFGGTRTHHRLVCGLEDAGWIIRDELDWIYASGFPKGKANLKPAHEPIVLARKPGPLRPLGIDAARIGTIDDLNGGAYAKTGNRRDLPGAARSDAAAGMLAPGKTAGKDFEQPLGRWPSNLLLSDPELFDEPNPWVVGSGATVTSGLATRRSPTDDSYSGGWAGAEDVTATYGDTGGYSRFFLVPKSSRADREPVVRGTLELGPPPESGRRSKPAEGRQSALGNPRANAHPTVKPTDLMRHLIRLVTPPGGTVLDPFLGSGSTAIAAELEGFPWIGIEQEPEYVAMAEARLNGTQRGLGLDTPLVGEPRRSVDGVAVRHNSGGNTFGGDKPKPPLPDMSYRQPQPTPDRPEIVPGLFDAEPVA